MENEAVEAPVEPGRTLESRAWQGRVMDGQAVAGRATSATGRDVRIRERSGYDISEIQRRVDDLVSIAAALAGADAPDAEPSPAVARLWVEVKLLAAAVQPAPAVQVVPAVPERERSVESSRRTRLGSTHRSLMRSAGNPVPSATDYWFG